jgi:hypothetical protein
MIRWLLAALALAGCLGQPEDLFSIDGSAIAGNAIPLAGATIKLQRDQGFSADGCTGFSDFLTLTTNPDGAFHQTLFRQQTRGPKGDRRCFRVVLEGANKERTIIVWPFADADVSLPPLALWPEDTFQFSFGASFRFPPMPPWYLFEAEGAEPFVYRAELRTHNQRYWRSPAPPQSHFESSERVAVFEVSNGAGIPGATVTPSAIQRIESYQRDPVGQLKAALFERRIEGRPSIPGFFSNPPAPLSSGAGCPASFQNLDAGCPLTDGDPTPVVLPAGTPALTLVFAEPTSPHQLVLQGLSVEGEWDALRVEGAVNETSPFQLLAAVGIAPAVLAETQLSRDDILPGLDLGPLALNSGGIKYTVLRIRAVNGSSNAVLKWVGEVSVY